MLIWLRMLRPLVGTKQLVNFTLRGDASSYWVGTVEEIIEPTPEEAEFGDVALIRIDCYSAKDMDLYGEKLIPVDEIALIDRNPIHTYRTLFEVIAERQAVRGAIADQDGDEGAAADGK